MIILSLLPIIAFFLLFIFLAAKNELPWEELVIKSALIYFASIALGFELLSLIRGLTLFGVVFLWVIFIFIVASLHWKMHTFLKGWQRTITFFSNIRMSFFEIISIGLIALILLILLITGFLSPPNIHDVLAYHMSRVMHWAQNQSLMFFPTPNTWQLWMPPHSELAQLNWQLLTGGDYFSAFHNWYSLIFLTIAVAGISKLLGASRKGQIISALFILKLPIVILQASGAKNDIPLAFIFSALVYFVVKESLASLNTMDYYACGLCFGLGVLTKGNFVFFAFPLMIWMLFSSLKKSDWRKTLSFILIGIVLTVILNTGHWIRNSITFGSPYFSGEESFLINARFGFDVVVSNLTRHVAVQMNGKYGFINEFVQSFLHQVHAWLDIPLFDPSITLGPREFYYVPTREEVAGNTFHFIISGFVFVFSLIGLIVKKVKQQILMVILLAFMAIFGVVLFSAVFRWQTWSTRFFIPYYVMFAPVVGYVFSKLFPDNICWLIGIILVLISINPLHNNYSRSFSWAEENRNSIWCRSRRGLLFANNEQIEGAVLELSHLMDTSGCRSYGLIMRNNGPEYLLWGALTPDSADYHIVHIEVENTTSVHSSKTFDPCGIVYFEKTEIDNKYLKDYSLVRRWQIGGEFPFSLLLSPDYPISE